MTTPTVSHYFTRAIGFCDGAARGNPGPAGAGIVLYDADNAQQVIKKSLFLGHTTNNVAEYRALIMLLEEAVARHTQSLTVKSDSELMVKQINGLYRVKATHLLPLYQQVSMLKKHFSHIEFLHIRREFNKEADLMSNIAIDDQV